MPIPALSEESPRWLPFDHLDLGMIILVNVACYAVELQVAKCKKKIKNAYWRRKWCHRRYANDHKKLLMPLSYREYSHKPWEGLLVATDKVADCCSLKWLDLKVVLDFPLQGMHGICCHANVLFIRPTPYTSQISIFSVCGLYLLQI